MKKQPYFGSIVLSILLGLFCIVNLLSGIFASAGVHAEAGYTDDPSVVCAGKGHSGMCSGQPENRDGGCADRNGGIRTASVVCGADRRRTGS